MNKLVKMKKLLLITACLMLLCECKCFARIGETLEQCENRYGKRITDKTELQSYAIWLLGKFSLHDSKDFGRNGEVKDSDGTYYFFRLDEFVICLKLDKGKVGEIIFSKSDKYNAEPREMYKEEIDAIVGANTKEIKCNHFVSRRKTLIIRTEEYKMKLEEKNADAKKEREEKQKNVPNES